MYQFSKKSIEQLNTCHSDLVTIMMVALSVSDIDFSITEGYRSDEKQKEDFESGASKVLKGKHNYHPSLACDIAPYYDNGIKWEKEHASYLAGVIHAVSELLFKEGKITHKIRWGGNWDMDGIILLDQSLDDRPHFELING